MTKEQSTMSKSSDVSSQGPPQPQGENVAAPTVQPGSPDHQNSKSRSQVLKSGHLFISSKGIGWTSWKKRWFVLTRTSLIFFRSDPNQSPQKGGEVNLTLGGIDLNNSASVEVKADKKLLTVFFPDGRDGRAFTLKAETTEELQEWKGALEKAVAMAPSAPNNVGQNEQADDSNGGSDEQKDGPIAHPGKTTVLGRPILLALEDNDGSPSFLEKALRFIEDHGLNCEGVLRQAADVEDVYRRVHEYEEGKTEFSPDEDAHIIGDCIKYILRELPSAPVPASCCNALVVALRSDRNNRANAIRTAILDTFPEPNRRLLQRILQMMQVVASNTKVNRMSTSAVAACMSPLLLRPLLAGECELGDTHMDVAGDGSFQLLQAAAAANHAQAIVIILLDEYDKIFGDASISDDGLFSDSEDSGSESEEASDDDMYEDDDDDYDDEDDDDENASDNHEESDDDYEQSVAESNNGSDRGHDENDDKDSERPRSSSKSPHKAHSSLSTERSLSRSRHSLEPKSANDEKKRNDQKSVSKIDSVRLRSDSPENSTIVHGVEHETERLEAVKDDSKNRIEEETNGNSKLQESLEKRKKALHDRRLALEKDVKRLQRERDLRANLKCNSLSDVSRMPEKIKVEVQKIEVVEEKYTNLKKKLDDIEDELRHQHNETIALLKARNIDVTNYEIGGKNQSSTNVLEASILKPSPSSFNKSSANSEERRNQITNEHKSIDQGQGSLTQPTLSPPKGPTHNSEKS